MPLTAMPDMAPELREGLDAAAVVVTEALGEVVVADVEVDVEVDMELIDEGDMVEAGPDPEAEEPGMPLAVRFT